jgi:uracil DNA glycosylase
VLLKQQTVIEFLAAENESVMNIHQQLKNVYGVSVVDKSTVSHWASQGQVKLIDAC